MEWTDIFFLGVHRKKRCLSSRALAETRAESGKLRLSTNLYLHKALELSTNAQPSQPLALHSQCILLIKWTHRFYIGVLHFYTARLIVDNSLNQSFNTSNFFL